jgi:hypothetical protein
MIENCPHPNLIYCPELDLMECSFCGLAFTDDEAEIIARKNSDARISFSQNNQKKEENNE